MTCEAAVAIVVSALERKLVLDHESRSTTFYHVSLSAPAITALVADSGSSAHSSPGLRRQRIPESLHRVANYTTGANRTRA